ncbi:MAG: tandem-95 repeat protein [Proteobacteria bacterium]|nr:tandem-95 repeat protein [Pseudomonadota bacterium]
MRNNPNTSAARAISETIGEDWLADLPQAMQVLEKRYVFDAALVADLTDAASHSGDSTVTASTDPSLGDVLNSAAESLATTEADASGASSPSAVYVIDANVDQADTLIAGLPADAVIIRIDSTSDGVAQLAEALEGMNNIGSLHIFAHGEAGSLSLGASVLDQASMETLYRATLAGLGTHLSADADIMIYGCNFAAGAEGQAAADTLAALTGADVSASTDLTGAARLGGDWDLEYDSGSIETQALSFAAYDATLDLASISASGAPTTSGGSNVGATATWSNVATVSGTTVDIRATVVSADAGATIGFGTTGDDLRVELENGTAVITWEIFVAGTTTPFTADVTFQIADLDGPNIETVSAAAAGTVESNTNLSIDTTGGIVTAAGTQNQNSESTSMIAYSWGGVSSMSVTYTAATGTDIRIFNHDGDLDLPFTDPVDVNTIGNNPPDAVNDSATTQMNTALSGTVATNDTDPDGDTLTYTQGTGPTNGTLTFNGNGTYTYTPNTGYTGTDSFTYSISDGRGGTDTATVTITITAPNSPPVAGDDTFNGNFNYVYIDSVANNDSDPNGDTLTFTQTSAAANGTVSLATDGSFSYTPNTGFSGTDTFTYSVSDGNGGSDTATVTITIPANSPPVAGDDTFNGNFNAAYSSTVATNDSDPNGDTLTYTLGTGPTNGTISLNTNGTFTYTPNTGYSGQDSFTYSISDGNGGTDTATATITVTGTVNNPPDAVNDAFNATYNAAFSSTVATNDTDPNGDTLTYTLGTGPTNGTVTLNTNGSFTYTPTPGYSGTDSFTYSISDGNGGTDTATVTLTVPGPTNNPPNAVNDSFGTAYNTSVSGDVCTNDTDADNDLLSHTLTTGPTNGTVTLNTDGTFTYTPNTGYSGTDTFTYTSNDGNGGTDTATVTITVGTRPNSAPDAVNDTVSTNADQPLTGTVATNDSDPDSDTLNFAVQITPTHGTVTLNTNGTFTYTPTAGYSGQDSFTYTVNDGNGGTDSAVVVVSVIAVNDAPVFTTTVAPQANVDGQVISLNIGANVTDVDSPQLIYAANGLPPGLSINPLTGVITGTLDRMASEVGPTENGVYPVTVTVVDLAGGVTTQTFTWTITNPGPDAVNDTVSTDAGVAYTGSVATNDRDPDGDPVTFALGTGPTHGTVTLAGNGAYTYTPTGGYNGPDSFTYTMTDSQGASDTATVSITVVPVNGPPVVTGTIPTQTGTDLSTPTLDISSCFADPQNDPLTFTATGLPPGLSINAATGVISGTVAQNAGVSGPTSNGVYSVVITATDPSGLSVNHTFSWTITNPAPDAVNDSFNGLSGQPVTGTVATNDSDPDGDATTYTIVSGPTAGSVVLNTNGTFTYSGNPLYSGTDSFVYKVTDADGSSDTATSTFTIAPTEIAPPGLSCIISFGDLSHLRSILGV